MTDTKGKAVDHFSATISRSHPFVRQKSGNPHPETDDFEEAIKASVAATSHGNPEEDKMIERAIRASVQELHIASNQGDDRDAVGRAIQASVAEATRLRAQEESRSHAGALDGTSDHSRELEAALHRSIQHHASSATEGNVANLDFDDSGVDTDDDDNIKLAIERSKSGDTGGPEPAQLNDEDLQKAIEISKKDHEDLEQSLSRSKTEEEIVLEYIKRQSLAEEQHKQSVTGRSAADENKNEEELQKAMKESFDLQNK